MENHYIPHAVDSEILDLLEEEAKLKKEQFGEDQRVTFCGITETQEEK